MSKTFNKDEHKARLQALAKQRQEYEALLSKEQKPSVSIDNMINNKKVMIEASNREVSLPMHNDIDNEQVIVEKDEFKPTNLHESVLCICIDVVNLKERLNDDVSLNELILKSIRDKKIELLKLYENVSKDLEILDTNDRILIVESEKTKAYDKIFELREQILNLRDNREESGETFDKLIYEKVSELLNIYEASFKQERLLNEQDRLVLVENGSDLIIVDSNKEEYEELIKAMSRLNDSREDNDLQELLIRLKNDNSQLLHNLKIIYELVVPLSGTHDRVDRFNYYVKIVNWMQLIAWFIVLLTLMFKN